MMDGRVKTLHPPIHGGILARRDQPDDLAAVAAHGIGLIDLVVVNLYPFARDRGEPGRRLRRARRADRHRRAEHGARGRQELPRRARRRRPGRLPARCWRRSTRGAACRAFRFELARKAFAHTGAYDTAIAATLAWRCRVDGDASTRQRPTHAARRHDSTVARATSSATCATARTRTSRPAWYAVGAGTGLRRRRRSSRARSCRSPTCSTSTPPRASCSSSPSRPRSSSSTPTRAAWRPARRRRRRLRARPRGRRARRPSAASSALNRPLDADDRRGDRLDVHRGGRSRRRRATPRGRCSHAKPNMRVRDGRLPRAPAHGRS